MSGGHRGRTRGRPGSSSVGRGDRFDSTRVGAGLGRVISDAYTDFNNRQMYALMLLLIIVATLVNMFLHVMDQRWAERRGIAKP